MSDRRYTGSVSLNELVPATITVKEIVITKRVRTSSIWLFGHNLTVNASIKLHVKDSGGTYRQVSSYDSTLVAGGAINLLSVGGAIENGTYVKITALSVGGGTGSVNLLFEIPYDDQIETMADALAAGLLQYIKDIKSVITLGRPEGLIRYVSGLGTDALGFGGSWATPYLTIGRAILDFPGGGDPEGGIIFFGSGQYDEDIELPDRVTLIGCNTGTGYPEIRGKASGSTAASVTLNNESKIHRVRIGKQDGDGGTTTCVIAIEGSRAEIDDCSTGGIGAGLSLTRVVFLNAIGGANEVKIRNSWLSGSGNVPNIIGGAADNSEIRENTFDNFTQDAILLTGGSIIDVEENTFLNINSGYFGVKAVTNRMNITGNSYSGEPGALHDDGIGINHIVQNNYIAEEVEETSSIITCVKASDTLLKAIEYDFTTYTKAIIKWLDADRPFGAAVPIYWAYVYNASGGNPSNAGEIAKRDRIKPWSTPPV